MKIDIFGSVSIVFFCGVHNCKLVVTNTKWDNVALPLTIYTRVSALHCISFSAYFSLVNQRKYRRLSLFAVLVFAVLIIHGLKNRK